MPNRHRPVGDYLPQTLWRNRSSWRGFGGGCCGTVHVGFTGIRHFDVHGGNGDGFFLHHDGRLGDGLFGCAGLNFGNVDVVLWSLASGNFHFGHFAFASLLNVAGRKEEDG